MTNPAELLSERRMMELSAQTVALLTSPGDDLVIAILAKARERAERALTALQDVDAENARSIRALQNEIRLYLDLLEHIKAVVIEGFEAEESFKQSTRDEARDFALDEEELARMGIVETRAPE